MCLLGGGGGEGVERCDMTGYCGWDCRIGHRRRCTQLLVEDRLWDTCSAGAKGEAGVRNGGRVGVRGKEWRRESRME